MSTKRKFTVTVVNTSTFEVEAEDHDHAMELAEDILCNAPDVDTMASIEERSTGWTATDAEES